MNLSRTLGLANFYSNVRSEQLTPRLSPKGCSYGSVNMQIVNWINKRTLNDIEATPSCNRYVYRARLAVNQVAPTPLLKIELKKIYVYLTRSPRGRARKGLSAKQRVGHGFELNGASLIKVAFRKRLKI